MGRKKREATMNASDCSKCVICIKYKTRKGRKCGSSGHLGQATKAFEIRLLGTLGGFGGRRSTKQYLHLLVDHFTRYAYIYTLPNQTGNEIIRLLNSVHQDNYSWTLLTG